MSLSSLSLLILFHHYLHHYYHYHHYHYITISMINFIMLSLLLSSSSSLLSVSFIFICCHDDVIKWEHFPRYWPFVRGIHRSPVNSPHKGPWRGALMFSLICVWINGWVNNREGWWFETLACPLWHHRYVFLYPVGHLHALHGLGADMPERRPLLWGFPVWQGGGPGEWWHLQTSSCWQRSMLGGFPVCVRLLQRPRLWHWRWDLYL